MVPPRSCGIWCVIDLAIKSQTTRLGDYEEVPKGSKDSE